ncbi:SMEK domain-containing protein [Serratia sp. 2723]|uniref:SMEK domain-containing protein n=1 Tax=unclassified Serratia (in: enterobacteria) TaxID=2647522 RepID=UPI003D1C00FA
MESESSFIARQLRFFTATLYAQIKLSTRDGLTDLAKNQEVSLLSLINLVYESDFIDLNTDRKNFPGVDYGSLSMKTGLQMTATVTKKKFQDTFDTHTNNAVLKQNYPNIWFFLLTVEPVKPSIKLPSSNIEYITLFDMVSEVLKKSTHFQKSFLDSLKNEYSRYFATNPAQGNSFSIPVGIPVPTDLMVFNELVSTQEWFPDNPGEGYLKVFNLIDRFHKQLSKCTRQAREILVSTIKLASPPTSQNEKIIVYADAVLGSLNIDEENISSFEYHYNFLELNDLVEKLDDFQDMYTVGEDVYIKNRVQFVLNYGTYEPELNLFSALLIFYLNRHNINDFENAFLNCDFSKLSDSLC